MLNEADFYGVQPLMDRLKVCKQLKSSTCGNLAFCGIKPPMENNFPINDWTDTEDLAPRSRNEEVLALYATDKWIAVAYASKIACYSTRQLSGEACPNNTFVTWLQPIPDGKPSFLALKSLKQSSREERSEQLTVACVTNNGIF